MSVTTLTYLAELARTFPIHPNHRLAWLQEFDLR